MSWARTTTCRCSLIVLPFGNVIHEWNAGAAWLPYRWRNKLNVAPGHCNFAAARMCLKATRGRRVPRVRCAFDFSLTAGWRLLDP